MAGYLFQLAGHILLPQCSVQDWEESAFSFPEFSCSHCIIFTSCLVFLPILPSWPISVFFKTWLTEYRQFSRTNHMGDMGNSLQKISIQVCSLPNLWVLSLCIDQLCALGHVISSLCLNCVFFPKWGENHSLFMTSVVRISREQNSD